MRYAPFYIKLHQALEPKNNMKKVIVNIAVQKRTIVLDINVGYK